MACESGDGDGSGDLKIPGVLCDSSGRYISIVCGSAKGKLYVEKLKPSASAGGKTRRVIPKCILSRSKWYSPSEFEVLGGSSAKKWRSSLMHDGCSLDQFDLDHVVGSVEPCSGMSANNGVAGQVASSFVTDVVLAFIKAYRMRGDSVSLKTIVLERFVPLSIEQAKLCLWSAYTADLVAAGLQFHQRRNSDKRLQVSADFDDIISWFECLDSLEKIPPIFCEALDLIKLPPLSLDPISEQVRDNSLLIKSLSKSIQGMEMKMTSFLERSPSSPNTEKSVSSDSGGPVTFADAVSSDVQRCNVHVPAPVRPRPQPPSSVVLETREANLILFGLPEGKSLVDTKAAVDDMLSFLTSRPVKIKDLYRIGRFVKVSESDSMRQRPRPVLIKLASAWDRKVVLISKRKLKDYSVSRLFIREDLPPIVRSQRKSRKDHDHVHASANMASCDRSSPQAEPPASSVGMLTTLISGTPVILSSSGDSVASNMTDSLHSSCTPQSQSQPLPPHSSDASLSENSISP